MICMAHGLNGVEPVQTLMESLLRLAPKGGVLVELVQSLQLLTPDQVQVSLSDPKDAESTLPLNLSLKFAAKEEVGRKTVPFTFTSSSGEG